MTAPSSPGADRIWAAIEEEKKRDRLLRRIATAAWIATFALVLILGVFAGLTVAQFVRAALVGALPWMSAFSALIPFCIVCGVVTLLIATLSTVGIFLRMRTTTLLEVQARLAALEQMLATRGDD